MKFYLFLLIFLLSFSLNSQKLYEINWKKESLIIGGSAAMAGGSFLLDSYRDPTTLPQVGSLPPNVNRFDRFALNNYSLSANGASNVLFYSATIAPLALLASSQLTDNRLEYLMMYGEVVALNAGFTFVVKSATDRKRPYFYNEDVPVGERQSLDARKSFFSGHASHTAAVSFFTASVFADVYPDSPWKPVVWVSAALIPATTAYLRVEAGRHFPSDVLVGYGVGAAIGVLVPYLHRSDLLDSVDLDVGACGNGVAVVLRF